MGGHPLGCPWLCPRALASWNSSLALYLPGLGQGPTTVGGWGSVGGGGSVAGMVSPLELTLSWASLAHSTSRPHSLTENWPHN